jgi:hypothetical protein
MRYAGNPNDVPGTMSLAGLTDAVAVAMEQRIAEHRSFTVEMFVLMLTVVKAQRIFRKHFNTARGTR